LQFELLHFHELSENREREKEREIGMVLRSQREHSVLFKPLHEKTTDLT